MAEEEMTMWRLLGRRLVKFFGDVPPEELPLMIAEDPSVLTQFVDEARKLLAWQSGPARPERPQGDP